MVSMAGTCAKERRRERGRRTEASTGCLLHVPGPGFRDQTHNPGTGHLHSRWQGHAVLTLTRRQRSGVRCRNGGAEPWEPHTSSPGGFNLLNDRPSVPWGLGYQGTDTVLAERATSIKTQWQRSGNSARHYTAAGPTYS
ncbi:hypothetical protein HJG60_011208 [Phyllostomus discolor]|uniref:Uncharacterized protein n=1 Tax=Phyllostomus discolor TaxID=89673 RepID=A0A834E548_9CHIR|nr:hypothetical protein HJG60_011208 [Phyllostomus discolor]